MEKISNNPPKVEDIIDVNEHTNEFKSFIGHCLELDPKKRYTADQLLKHEFITKFSQGRNYMMNLVYDHIVDIEKFRLESEEEYQKMLKKDANNKSDESQSTENNVKENKENELILESINRKGSYQDENEDNLDSFDDKIKRFFKKNKYEKKDIIKNDEKDEKTKIKKLEFDKSVNIQSNESILVHEDKSMINKENNIIFDSNIEKQENNNSSNLKIIKNNEFEIFCQKNVSNNNEKNNEEKNIFRLSISSIPPNNGNNSLLDNLTQKTTEDNSRKGIGQINDSNTSSINKNKNKIHVQKDSCDIYFYINDDELKTHENRKPLEFENKCNDISFINKKEQDKNEENIDDSDDEGVIHETYDYKNNFKGLDIYHKKLNTNPNSESSVYKFAKHYEGINSF